MKKEEDSSAKSLSKAKSPLISPLQSPKPESKSPPSVLRSPTECPAEFLSQISDLKDLVSSGLESSRRRLDEAIANVLKENDASFIRISEKVKIQAQACKQLAEEADTGYKKLTGEMEENLKAIQVSNVELMEEVQASTSRMRKETIPELARKAEKAIESLRERYGIPENPL